MNAEINSKTLWDNAGKGGLILGAITVGFMLLSFATTLLPENSIGVFLSTILSFILWAAKFGGCIYVMYCLMKKFAADFPSADKAAVRKYGIFVGITSALIVAAFQLIYMLYIAPDTIAEAFETAMQTYSSMLDSNSMEVLEGLQDRMPVINFFTQFIYCSLFGLVIASIFAGKIRPDDPFA